MRELPLPQSWVEWHAALTHFPITLLFVALFFDLVALFWEKPRLRETSLWLLGLAVVALPFALLSGLFTGREYKRAPMGYDDHWQAAVATSALALVLLVWRLAAHDKLPRWVRAIVLTLTFACALGIGYTGHQGGEMVFGGREVEAPTESSDEAAAPGEGAEKIAVSAGKMEVAAEKLDVATDRLALAAQHKQAPPTPNIVVKPQIQAVPPSALNDAAQKLENVAVRFEQTAGKLDRIAQDLQNVKPSGPAPAGGVKVETPGGATAKTTPAPASGALDPKLIARGEKLYSSEDLGCADCHKMNGQGSKKGPDLTHAGQLHGDIEWQIGHLKDPGKFVPGSKMPAYDDQKPDDLRALATFLVSKK